jgi:Bacterial SH3 domain
MKITSGRNAVGTLLFLLAFSTSVLAQQASVRRNVILRRDPSTSSPVLEHLAKGVRITLVDASPDSGFYHVRSEDDQIGWVLSKYVTVEPLPAGTPTNAGTSTTGTAPPAGSCDPNLWNHVYHSYRLIVKQPCIAVTGTIVDATATQSVRQPDGVRHEGDGDTHGWLKVDPQFQNLLNGGNMSDEGGNLVFEIICRYPVKQKDAQSACQGYTDHVVLPPVGSRVTIVGVYVQDTFHAKWNEIHPVTSITVIP